MKKAAIPNRTELEQHILDYLKDRPNAADTLSGITQWWVLGNKDKHNAEVIMRVLDELADRGELLCRQRPDGTKTFVLVDPSGRKAKHRP